MLYTQVYSGNVGALATTTIFQGVIPSDMIGIINEIDVVGLVKNAYDTDGTIGVDVVDLASLQSIAITEIAFLLQLNSQGKAIPHWSRSGANCWKPIYPYILKTGPWNIQITNGLMAAGSLIVRGSISIFVISDKRAGHFSGLFRDIYESLGAGVD